MKENRKIKFRDYDHDNNVMRYFDLDGYDRQEHDAWGNTMQYTGISDKNGVDIYEGDIVRILYTDWPSNTDPNTSLEDYLISISHVGEVVYDAPSFGILMFKENRYGERPIADFNYGAHGRIEVIGNIHENPELL